MKASLRDDSNTPPAVGVGRRLAPAAENGTFSDFPKGNHGLLCLRYGILFRKMPGGSLLPPYAVIATLCGFSYFIIRNSSGCEKWKNDI